MDLIKAYKYLETEEAMRQSIRMTRKDEERTLEIEISYAHRIKCEE